MAGVSTVVMILYGVMLGLTDTLIIEEEDIALATSINLERDPSQESATSFSKWRSQTDPKADQVEDEDMDLTVAQYIALYTPSSGRSKRQARQHWADPWPNGVVPYLFNRADYDDMDQADIRKAMRTIEKWSCVKFRLRERLDKNYILFTGGDGTRCSSSVGMMNRGEQAINLATYGCRLISTYIHEILHALGFVHEHQLPTRRGFLKVYLVNAKAEKHHNFFEYAEEAMVDYRQQYDLGSIMHYDTRSFSSNGGKTMTTGRGWQDEYFGRNWFNELSFGDVKGLNMFYKCAEKCAPNDACERRGGILLKDCSCLTPDDYDDRTCNDAKPASYCEDKLLTGECFRDQRVMGSECPKTCGFCSVFKINAPAKIQDEYCDDYHHNPAKCAEWKAAGYCDEDTRHPSYSKWMKTYCRKTCNKCGEVTCPNILAQEYVCLWYDQSYCTDAEAVWGRQMRKSCPARCGLCGVRKEGECDNVRSDAECKRRAAANECEENSVQMFQDCPKTCDRCPYNKGKCQNFHSDEADCLQLAAENHCASGGNKVFMQKRCAKACNTCHMATVPCEDIDPPRDCANFAQGQHCVHPMRAQYMRRRCAKACGYC